MNSSNSKNINLLSVDTSIITFNKNSNPNKTNSSKKSDSNKLDPKDKAILTQLERWTHDLELTEDKTILPLYQFFPAHVSVGDLNLLKFRNCYLCGRYESVKGVLDVQSLALEMEG